MRDFRHALRGLRRSPGFTLLAVCTLGLAIGVNVGMLSVIDTVLLKPLPFAESDRLVQIEASAPGSDFTGEFGVADEFFLQYKEHSKLIEDVSTFNSFTSTLRVGDRVERIAMSAPTLSLFSTLGVKPLIGRLPVPEDEEGVAVISHALWTSWFGGDESVLGQTHSVSGRDRTIIGVMPENFWFPNDNVLLWFPDIIRAEGIQLGRFGRPLVARLVPGADQEQLKAELTGLALAIPDRFGGSANYLRLIEKHQPVVRSLDTFLLGDISGPLWVLLASMGIVLVIACANVGNLFMVRGERRQADQAVRRALGAARRRLMASQMTEVVTVALLSGVLAVLLAWAVVPLLVGAAPAEVPRLGEVGIGLSTLVYTFGASVVAALLCGMVPAIRFSAPNLSRIREGRRGNTSGRHWGRTLLVVAQTALALVLLVGSALLVQSFNKLSRVDPGYSTEDIFTFQIAPEGEHLNSDETYARFHVEFAERLKALPGVESVGLIENVPLDEGVRSGRFLNEDQAGQPDGGSMLSFTWANRGYFETMDIEVLKGRTLTEDEQFSRQGQVMVSRSAADTLWPGQDPIGRRLQMEESETWLTVTGVVDDVLQYGFRQEPLPMVYFPLVSQDAENGRVLGSPGYVLKTPRAEEIAADVRALVREVAPSAPMYRTYTMAGLASSSMTQLSFAMMTLGVAAAMALLLGLIGLYGVLSYAVAERTREIGLRMALGAQAEQVRGMIVGQGARVLLVGTVVGLGAAAAATRSLDGLLFDMGTFDVKTYLVVALLTVSVGLAASYVPARRASKVDPMESLRAE